MKPKIGMKRVHVNIPDNIFEKICDLEREGVYPNFSDAGRIAIRDLLKKYGIYDIEKFKEYKRR